jgi:copper oxidase (laccase) domain-containing protein
MIHQQRKRVSLDLTIPLVAQLLEAGIAKKNIVIGQQCTACQKNEFFSFRGEGKILGEMLGIISLT